MRTLTDRPIGTDRVLIALGALIAATLLAFFFGYFPYPFGIIVLACFAFARFQYLRRRHGPPAPRD